VGKPPEEIMGLSMKERKPLTREFAVRYRAVHLKVEKSKATLIKSSFSDTLKTWQTNKPSPI
jgi:hypothetical protein